MFTFIGITAGSYLFLKYALKRIQVIYATFLPALTAESPG